MSIRQQDDRAARRRPSWTVDASVFAIAGMILLVILCSVAVFLGVSTKGVLSIVMLFVAAFSFLTHRIAFRQRTRLERLRSDQIKELEEWQDRWQQLHQETQEATSALARMRDGVIMLDRNGNVLLINPAARRLLAVRDHQDLSLRPFSESVRIPELTRAISAANSGDGTQKRLLEIPHERGICPVKVRVDRFGASPNNHVLITLRDETEAHRVDEMRREFIANISHELKTPLAAIKGYAETVELAIKDDPDAAVHFMTQIHTQCLRLERLIADMMQLARAQAGRGNLNITDLSMTQSIQESLKSYRPVAESKRVELVFLTPDATPLIRGDAEAMLTITNNLVGNAVRYTPEGGKVTISCRDAGTHWALVVEDTGIGIAESDQKRIFERFYRVGKGRGTGDGGTGIGLSIVKNLTLTLGGEVRVASRPGEGAKFEVLLPKAQPPAEPRQEEVA